MNHYAIADFPITWGASTKVGKFLFTAPYYQVGMPTPYSTQYAILDEEQRVIVSDFCELTEAELADWGTDDMYIINIIAQKAGVTLV
jgi:hypothetical protein